MDQQDRKSTDHRQEQPVPVPDRGDLSDSKRDTDRLQGEEATIELPDVTDIPGQEHVHVLPLGELSDTTASSDDEEGTDLLGQ